MWSNARKPSTSLTPAPQGVGSRASPPSSSPPFNHKHTHAQTHTHSLCHAHAMLIPLLCKRQCLISLPVSPLRISSHAAEYKRAGEPAGGADASRRASRLRPSSPSPGVTPPDRLARREPRRTPSHAALSGVRIPLLR